MIYRTRAPAKINLTLHVLGRRDDGFHELESLVAFAGCSDLLELDSSGPLSLDVAGPTAPATGLVEDNLVLKAARALAQRVPGLRTGAFRLTKRLPVGAGIGGGSSDAAAGLRLLARLNGLRLDDERLHDAAQATGSDVPVCVEPRTQMMRGRGERLDRSAAPRGLCAVLANPGIHLETRGVFAAMGWSKGQATVLDPHPAIHEARDSETFLSALAEARNDMQDAAMGLAPAVLRALDALADLPGARLTRMSGSGSTCFALFDSRAAARRAGAIMRERHPDWWIRATPLM